MWRGSVDTFPLDHSSGAMGSGWGGIAKNFIALEFVAPLSVCVRFFCVTRTVYRFPTLVMECNIPTRHHECTSVVVHLFDLSSATQRPSPPNMVAFMCRCLFPAGHSLNMTGLVTQGRRTHAKPSLMKKSRTCCSFELQNLHLP